MEEVKTDTQQQQDPPAGTQPAFVESEYLKNNFGVETVDALKTRLEAAATFETNFNTANQELERIKPEYERLNGEFANMPETVKYVYDLHKKGVHDIKTVIQYHDVNPDNMNDEQAIKLASKIRNKGWEEKHVNADYQSRFAIDPDDTTIDETARTLREGERIKTAQNERAYLKEFIGKQFAPPAQQQQNERAEAQKIATQQWSQKIPALVSDLKTFSDTAEFTVNGKTGEVPQKVQYSFAVPDNDLQSITEYALRSAVASGAQLNDQGIAKVREFVSELIQAKYAPQIRKAYATAINNSWIDFIDTEFNNKSSSALGGGGAHNNGTNPGQTEREKAWHEKARKDAANGSTRVG